MKSLVGKVSTAIVLLVFIIASLFILNIVKAQNITPNDTNQSQSEIDLCENVVCPISNQTCPDGTVATCQNSCDSSTGVCSSCTPDCTGHENPCVNTTCEDSITVCPDGYQANCSNVCDPATGQCSLCTLDCTDHEKCVENWQCTEWSDCVNGTQIRTCNDINNCNTTENKPLENQSCVILPSCNLTCGICQELNSTTCSCMDISPCCGNSVCESEEDCSSCPIDCGNCPEIPESVFDINIEYPEKITRGETIIVKANVKNINSLTVRNVFLNWVLPSGFEIISGNQREDCGVLDIDNFCISEIIVKTDFSTNLGIREIKIVVDYEK